MLSLKAKTRERINYDDMENFIYAPSLVPVKVSMGGLYPGQLS